MSIICQKQKIRTIFSPLFFFDQAARKGPPSFFMIGLSTKNKTIYLNHGNETPAAAFFYKGNRF